MLRQNQDLLRNASSLAATTGLTSLLGFAFWVYAARVFASDAVGYGSAAISSTMLLGTVGQFGLDSMLIGEIPRGGNRGGLTMAACIAAFVGSFVLGLGWAFISLAYGSRFVELNGTVGRMALFSFGVAITGATLVFDSATIGFMRGGLQLSRNTAFSVAKMAALPVAALILHDMFGVGIILAWFLGTVFSMLPVAIQIIRTGGSVLHSPDWENLWRLRKLVISHNWLNLAIKTPSKLIPVLVALVVAPSSNGAFYIATMISSFLFMVPQSLSTVLFAVASGAPEKFPEKLRFVLRMSLVIGVPIALAMALSAHLILSFFSAADANLATGPLLIMIVGYLPGLFNPLYIAVARVAGKFNQASIFLTIFALIQMAALVVGGKIAGLYGLSYAMLAVSVVQALIIGPSVLRAAFAAVSHQPAVDAEPAGRTRPQLPEPVDWTQMRQEAGLAALIALATSVSSADHATDDGQVPDESLTPLAMTTSQPVVDVPGQNRLAATSAMRSLSITGTNWWPELDEATYSSRQENGVDALIALATQRAGL